MFTIYYSNLLETQKDILIHLMEREPLSDPFAEEVILVQSPGMAQWLQWQIAEKQGIASNLHFPMPASFIWQQYTQNLTNVEKDNPFNKDYMTWRLMRLIKQYLNDPAFEQLNSYLQKSTKSEQQKCYQLARKIADLFDQYLVYRPDWIQLWEKGQDNEVIQQIKHNHFQDNSKLFEQIEQHAHWQGILWRALVEDTKQDNAQARHRADLQLNYLNQLQQQEPKNLPKRIFIFGISALPQSYLEILQALAKHIDIHLFFTNGCREYWGDIVDEKLRLRQRLIYQINKSEQQLKAKPLFSEDQIHALEKQQTEITYDDETLQVGNPLLASWGKQGRDFLYLLTDLGAQEIEAYVDLKEDDASLLSQVKHHILNFTPSNETQLHKSSTDNSLSINSCYSPMREVEALQDYLLNLLNENPDLTPKDIVVMVADIDQYTPYIQAVFGQGKPYIPFSISDNKLTESDILVSSFLQLLNLKDSQFSAEEVLAFLDIPAIHQHFNISVDDLKQIHHWTKESGIRYGLTKNNNGQSDNQQALRNYNSWQAGLDRMLLGFAMREENAIWQDNLGLNESEGLRGQLIGNLAEFLNKLWDWHQKLLKDHPINQWKEILLNGVDNFYDNNDKNQSTLFYLKEQIQTMAEKINSVHFDEAINAEVITQVMDEVLQENPNSVKFLVGKVNFCTLLPMRSVPFKVVCLLGMNDADYPRKQTPNSFDLVQYTVRKGDRFRRDDDRYLFLEALLSAQDYFYLSYVGHSIIDDSENEPSVLVSQLLDYLSDNLVDKSKSIKNALELDNKKKEIRHNLIHEHSMTPFAIQNFSQYPYSFSKRWFDFAQRNLSKNHNFITNTQVPIEQASSLLNPVNLEQLIAFVQNPVKYFFQRQLGIYLDNSQEGIPENERFSLNNLESYKLRTEFTYFDKDQREEEWHKWQVKGSLPRGNFAEVTKLKEFKEIDELKKHIQSYLDQEPSSLSIPSPLKWQDQEIYIEGYLNSLYNNNTELVLWRSGSIRNKDIIQLWINYLILVLISPDETQSIPSATFFGKKNWIQFKNENFTKEKAMKQLKIYLSAYALKDEKIFLIPSEKINDYWKVCNTPEFDFNQCLSKLEEITIKEDTRYNCYADIYWCRIMSQQNFTEEQIKEINSFCKNWFETMLETKQQSYKKR